MKQIQPIQIWSNGHPKQASILDARIINDDLQSSCTFYYELREADTVVPPAERDGASSSTPGTRLAEGNLSVTGAEYDAWNGDNDFAYSYIANALNLTILTGSVE